MRNEAELAKKNVEISMEFSRFVLAHPELDERIPDNALIVFEVSDDRDLTEFNHSLAQRTREPGQPVVVVRIKGLAPTRLLEPEVVPAP